MSDAIKEQTIAKKLKNELSTISYSDDELKGLVSGFVRNGGSFSLGSFNSSKLRIKTELASAARLVFKVFKHIYNLETNIVYENKTKFSKKLAYTVVAKGNVLDIVEELEIKKDLMDCNVSRMLNPEYFRGFIAGCFIGSGSLSDPYKAYFLEISFNDMDVANRIKDTLNNLYLLHEDVDQYHFKTIIRRNKAVLYLKRSDDISNFLAYLGATNTMLHFESVRIEKDFYNSENRLNNCDANNYDKAEKTGLNQVEMINKILSNKKIESFDEKTQAVIKARLNNPDNSYSELVLRLQEQGYRLSKTAITDIFTKLKEIEKGL